MIFNFLHSERLQMIEGYPPFVSKSEEEAAKAYSSNERPPFGAPAKYYAHGLQE